MDSSTHVQIILAVHNIAKDLKWLDIPSWQRWTTVQGENRHVLNHEIRKTINGQEYIFTVEGSIRWHASEFDREIYSPMHPTKTFVTIFCDGVDEINENNELSMFFAHVLVDNLGRTLGMKVI